MSTLIPGCAGLCGDRLAISKRSIEPHLPGPGAGWPIPAAYGGPKARNGPSNEFDYLGYLLPDGEPSLGAMHWPKNELTNLGV